MLDIYTYIISNIVFSDLVLDLCFHDTDTWYSCDMHYLDYMTFLDLHYMIMLYDSYSSMTSHVHYIHGTPCMHDRLAHDPSSRFFCYCYYYQFSIIQIILFLLFQCATHVVTTIFIFFFYCSFPSCTLVGPLLTDLYYFAVSRLEDGIESWS